MKLELSSSLVRQLDFRIPRLPWDAYWMLEAHLKATRSTCDRGSELLMDPGRHSVGAVIVKDRLLIAMGYNGSPPGVPHCDSVGHTLIDGHCVGTLHAERNAINQCCMNPTSPTGGTIYVTASPCFDCAKDILRVGLTRVVYGESYDSRYGMSNHVRAYLEAYGVAVEHLDVREYLYFSITEIDGSED